MSAPLAHSHSHPHAHVHASERKLMLAFVLTTVAMLAEAAGGFLAGSLALLADAGHMLADTLALMLAWISAHLARRPADAQRSFGYARFEVLAAYTNALAQAALSIWIAAEAVSRFASPQPIHDGLMLVVALAGLAINALVLGVLGQHDHDDLNHAGARLHVIGDLLGSLGAVVAALLIRGYAWLWADAATSVLVAALILAGALGLLRRSAHILLEGTPEGAESALVAASVRAHVGGVDDVHHVHVWQLAGGSRMATLHVRLAEGVAAASALAEIQHALHQHFHIAHATVQIEHGHCHGEDCAH
ncbi:MAG TPA: cation diffusion facilitator family transporter [Rudaea sp.]|nr:cation diffusion facilitator family transporter [Rudaea sp.]